MERCWELLEGIHFKCISQGKSISVDEIIRSGMYILFICLSYSTLREYYDLLILPFPWFISLLSLQLHAFSLHNLFPTN